MLIFKILNIAKLYINGKYMVHLCTEIYLCNIRETKSESCT